MLKCCEDCYYKGLKKCYLYERNLEEIESCEEYLLDPYINAKCLIEEEDTE